MLLELGATFTALAKYVTVLVELAGRTYHHHTPHGHFKERKINKIITYRARLNEMQIFEVNSSYSKSLCVNSAVAKLSLLNLIEMFSGTQISGVTVCFSFLF